MEYALFCETLDPVTRFHIRNGAILHAVNWMGNPSSAGMQSSFGIMVNYLYDLPLVESNAIRFLEEYKIPVGTSVLSLLNDGERSSEAR